MSNYKQYSREEIIIAVQEWYKNNGKIVIRDLRHKNNLPSVTQVINIFGSFQNCIKEANIPIAENKKCNFNREYHTDEELIELYADFVNIHLENNIFLPTGNDIDSYTSIPSYSTYLNRFGSLENLNKMIGYDVNEFNRTALEKDMIQKYIEQSDIAGHALTSREITELSKNNKQDIYCTETYMSHFGSISNLQELCGFDKTRTRTTDTKQDYIDKLIWLNNELGRRPIQTDLINYKNVPSASAYCRKFGSFTNALKEAGLEYEKTFYANNGIKCKSSYEQKFANMLEKYKINYVNETPYKDVIPGFDRMYRFDFVIDYNGNKYYIELFCIEGNDLYEKRKQHKIEICNFNNIPLISVYQKDIYGKSYENIYKFLIKNIENIVKEVA